jgi:hypothetical protein
MSTGVSVVLMVPSYNLTIAPRHPTSLQSPILNATVPSCFSILQKQHPCIWATIGAGSVITRWIWLVRQRAVYPSSTEADIRLDHNQINLYSGRGVLAESQGPVWMVGTSFEHSQFYNYQIASAKDVYLSAIQSETA